VYLKDFWRTDLPGIQREGDVYRELHDAQVPNIPVLGRAGDVPISPDHASTAPFAAQRTKTQDYLKGSGHGHEWCPGRPQVDPYVHYRLVLETLGQPLNTFKSTRQLCEVIRDAIVGGARRSILLSNGLTVRDSAYCGLREDPYLTSGCERGKYSYHGGRFWSAD
jgi:hypothetical protein